MNTNFNGPVNNSIINNHVTTNNINHGIGRSGNLNHRGGQSIRDNSSNPSTDSSRHRRFIQVSQSKSSPFLETVVRIGLDGLPILPNYVIPHLKKDITVSHCQKPEVYTYFLVLDPEQRGYYKTSRLNNEVYGKVYQRLLTQLYDTILNKGMRQTEKRWVESFRSDGFCLNGQLPTNKNQIKMIIDSPVMRKKFKEDLLFPFCFTLRSAYRHSQDKFAA